MNIYEIAVEKLKNKEELTEEEIRNLVWNAPIVEEIEGDELRWERCMTSIIDLEGQLYAINWQRGLTEMQENSYYEQPYKVRRVEKVVTKTIVEYESEECYEERENKWRQQDNV